MALTDSHMLPLGTKAPSFDLFDAITGAEYSLKAETSAPATVVMFICNHCPYVKYIQSELVRLTEEYLERGVDFFAISSNDIEKYPDDAPEKMKELGKKLNFKFPYLFDPTQEVARSYKAACTPDFFLFDKHLHLAYRGQLDDSRPGNEKPLNGKDLRAALDSVLNEVPVSGEQKPSQGCNIKWKQ